MATTHGTFTKRTVSRDDLEAVVNASLRAATASAAQNYSLITVEEPQTIRRLCGYESPSAVVYCVDFNRTLDIAAYLGEKCEADGIVPFITYSIDTILAAQNGAVAAKSLGLDYMFTNGIHRGDVGRVYKLLELPERHCVPLIMLLLGYADHPALPRGRLGGPGIVHRGKYGRISRERAGEIVAEYGEKEKRLGLDGYLYSEGFNNYFDWFFNEWSRSVPGQSYDFEDLLRRAGFLKQ
jgi:nitroreductase